MSDWFLQGDYGAVPSHWPGIFLSLLLSFTCGHLMAWVYMITHSGLSYSRTFVNSLVIMPMIVSLVMMVLANSLVTAFGMMAVFAIVRFRNILRDTLDTTYILVVLVIGMAAGTQKYASALLGCLLASASLLYLWYTAFGTRHRYDLIVNLHWSRPVADLAELRRVLDRHSRESYCASQRAQEGYAGADLSYRLLLRDSQRIADLLSELSACEGVSRVSTIQAEDESEL